MILKLNRLLPVILALFIILAGCGGAGEEQAPEPEDQKENAQKEETKKSISIGLDPYNFAAVPAYLSKVILEQQGYDVEIVEAQVGILFSSLANGEIDAFIDIWSPNLHKSYLEKLGDDFEIAGTLYSGAPIGIAVPKYLKDVNSITDLKEHKEQFDGKIYAIEKGTGMANTTKIMFETYDMDFEMVNSSTAGMVAEAQRVISNNGAIAFHAWRPHTMFTKLDIKMLEDPKNVWKSDNVQIGVVPDLKEKSPVAFTLFSNMKLEIPEIEKWLFAIEEDNKAPQELAEAWVQDNQDKVNQWLGK